MGRVTADVYGDSGTTRYRYQVELSADELLSMAEKLCSRGSPTPERTALVRSAIETLRTLADQV